MADRVENNVFNLQRIQVNSKTMDYLSDSDDDSAVRADRESHVVNYNAQPNVGTSQDAVKKLRGGYDGTREGSRPRHSSIQKSNKLVNRKGKVASHTVIEVENQSEEESYVPMTNIFVVTDQIKQRRHQQRKQDEHIELSATHRRGHVTIEIESNAEEVTQTHLHFFLLVMYYLGLSTFKPGASPSRTFSLKASTYNVLQKARFWIIVTLSLLHSLRLTKIFWLYFVGEQGIINFVNVGFRIVAVLIEVFTVRVFGFLHGKIRRMLFCLNELKAFQNNGGENDKGVLGHVTTMVTILSTLSVLMCIFQTATGYGIVGWTLKTMTLKQSEHLSYGLFIWTVDDLTVHHNVTAILTTEYGTTLTFITGFMGSIGTLMALCSNLKLEFTVNFMIAAGWTLKYFIRKLAMKVQNINFKNYTNGDDCAEMESPLGFWAEYKMIKTANKAINMVFDGLLKIMHANNIMLCTEFLMRILENNVMTMDFFFLVYNIIKLAVAYHIAKQSHGYNAVFQQWIRDWAMNSNDTKFLLRVPAILDEMAKEPLGLGTGDFIIGEGFIFRFVGMVSSIFMLQVDKSDGDE